MAIEMQRRLDWEGCLNVRDLGGYETADGRETRWGSIVRADNLRKLTEAGQAALVDYGVRTIVDLRLPRELEEHPNPFAEERPHGIAFHHLSLVDPAATPAGEFTTLADDYSRLLDRFRPGVAEIMKTIAAAGEGAVLIHCHAGKDRTGIISALLLELAGVPRETIGLDYALTAECLRSEDEHWLEHGPGDRATREYELSRRTPTAEVMIEVLDRLDDRYGGAEAYLLGAGVTPEEIGRLRERLLSNAG